VEYYSRGAGGEAAAQLIAITEESELTATYLRGKSGTTRKKRDRLSLREFFIKGGSALSESKTGWAI
jgi:hypothetical protein